MPGTVSIGWPGTYHQSRLGCPRTDPRPDRAGSAPRCPARWPMAACRPGPAGTRAAFSTRSASARGNPATSGTGTSGGPSLRTSETDGIRFNRNAGRRILPDHGIFAARPDRSPDPRAEPEPRGSRASVAPPSPRGRSGAGPRAWLEKNGAGKSQKTVIRYPTRKAADHDGGLLDRPASGDGAKEGQVRSWPRWAGGTASAHPPEPRGKGAIGSMALRQEQQVPCRGQQLRRHGRHRDRGGRRDDARSRLGHLSLILLGFERTRRVN